MKVILGVTKKSLVNHSFRNTVLRKRMAVNYAIKSDPKHILLPNCVFFFCKDLKYFCYQCSWKLLRK